MPLIEWNDDKLNTGVALIDNQHKMLVHLINKLATAVENHEIESITSIFSQLQDYTKYHFNTEETYFFRLNSKDTLQHTLQHNNFIKQLKEIKESNTELTKVSSELLQFLSEWLINHIQIEDKKFIDSNT